MPSKELYSYYYELQKEMNYEKHYNLIADDEVECIDFSKLSPNDNFYPDRGRNTRYDTNTLLEKENDIKKTYLVKKIIDTIRYEGLPDKSDYTEFNEQELKKFDEIVSKTRNGADLKNAFFNEIIKPENDLLFLKAKDSEFAYEMHKDKITTRINMSMDAKGEHEIDKFGKFLNVGKEFKGDENMALFQTLKMMDKALMDENNKDFKATFEKIGFELTDINGKKIQINAKLGEGYFQKDLDHLIKMGCNDCNIGTASKIANNLFEKSTELKGGVGATTALAESIGDESVKAFVSNMERVTNITGLGKTLPKENKPSKEKSAEKSANDLSEAQVLEGMGKAYAQKIASGAIKAPQEKVREHSNQKSLGASR